MINRAKYWRGYPLISQKVGLVYVHKLCCTNVSTLQKCSVICVPVLLLQLTIVHGQLQSQILDSAIQLTLFWGELTCLNLTTIFC